MKVIIVERSDDLLRFACGDVSKEYIYFSLEHFRSSVILHCSDFVPKNGFLNRDLAPSIIKQSCNQPGFAEELEPTDKS